MVWAPEVPPGPQLIWRELPVTLPPMNKFPGTHSPHTHTHTHTHTHVRTHTHTHTQACPFQLKVFTDSCEAEIEIIDIVPFDPEVTIALCHMVVERGVSEAVWNGDGQLITHTYTTPHLSSIVVENKVCSYIYIYRISSKKCRGYYLFQRYCNAASIRGWCLFEGGV